MGLTQQGQASAMSSQAAQNCRMNAAEWEKRADSTNESALKRSYQSLARQWRDLAHQIDDLEREKGPSCDSAA